MGIPFRLWRARSVAVVGLCVLAMVTFVIFLQISGVKSGLEKGLVEVAEFEHAQRLARHFETRYQSIVSTPETRINPRVFWTGLLQTALAGFPDGELAYSIADPVAVPVEFSARVSGPGVNEYLVQITARLAGDTALIDLLNRLQGIKAEFIRNRSCSVKRTGEGVSLRLDCVYSILDLVVRENHQ